MNHHVANCFIREAEKYPELQNIEYEFILEMLLDFRGRSVGGEDL